MKIKSIEERLDEVETKTIYIMEVLEKNANILKSLVEQIQNFENRAYNDEAILKIHDISNQNAKSINTNIETLTNMYKSITDNTNSITEIHNHLTEIYDLL